MLLVSKFLVQATMFFRNIKMLCTPAMHEEPICAATSEQEGATEQMEPEIFMPGNFGRVQPARYSKILYSFAMKDSRKHARCAGH